MRRLGSGRSAGSRGLGRSAASLAILVAGLMALMSGSASAGYLNPVEFSGSGSEPGQIGMPGRAAVEQSTGDLFAVDTENDRVVVFKPGADGATEFLTEFGTGQLSEPWGIAIGEDVDDTYVYVADAGNDRIVKYDSDEAATPAFTLDGSFTSPALGTGTGQVGDFKAALAVDPTNGDLLVADPVRNRVIRLEADGTPVAGGEFDGSAGSGSPGAFTGLADIAVNSSGDVYVIDQTGNVLAQEGTAQALRYSAAGSYKATLTPVGPNQRPATVAVRPDTDEVAVSGEQDAAYRYDWATIHLFDSANQTKQTFQAYGWTKSVFGLALSSGPESRLYVLTAGAAPPSGPVSPGGMYHAYSDYPPPLVQLEPATVNSTFDATFEGTVDPEGIEAAYRFELKPAGGSGDWLIVSSGTVEGDDPVTVTATENDLDAATEYSVRLIATSAAGDGTAAQTFTTAAAAPPVVRTLAGSGRTMTEVRLNGLIRANGVPTEYYVEWGTTTAYGERIPPAGTLPAGGSQKALVFSQKLEGLSPGETIHYRYVAESSEGTATGEDRTVETLSQPLGFEMISPPDKNGNGITQAQGSGLSEDGNVALFWASGAFAGSEGNLPGSVYRATRGATNWSTEALQPPDRVEAGAHLFNAKQTSVDLTRTVQASHIQLTPDAVGPPGTHYLYLRDNLTGERELMASSPDRRAFMGQSMVMGGSKDFSKVLIASEYPLTEDAPAGGMFETSLYLYDADTDELELISKLPDGTPTVGVIDPTSYRNGPRAVSADGSRVFWQAGYNGLYLHEADATIPISVSKRPGDPATAVPAFFEGASEDGSIVYFSSWIPLTPDAATDGSTDLYRYDVERDELKDLTAGPGDLVYNGSQNIDWIAVNADGSRVYFLAPGDRTLTPDAVENMSNLYLWEEGAAPEDPGELTWIAAVGLEKRIATVRMSSIATSPNGMQVSFVSNEPSLSNHSVISPNCKAQFDPVGYCNQVYTYDAADDQLSCASCSPVGRPVSNSGFGGRQKIDEAGMVPRVVLDDGSTFFETPNQLVPEDVNNRIDVYRWRHGQVDLVSTGQSTLGSYFGDATPDGSTITIFTSDQLVKQDTDDVRDMYAVRVNGGLPAQNTVTPDPAPCVGEACREGGAQTPGELSPATPSFSGGGNVKEPPRKHCPKGKRLKKVKGKQRCVKAKKGKHKKRAQGKRREGSK